MDIYGKLQNLPSVVKNKYLTTVVNLNIDVRHIW